MYGYFICDYVKLCTCSVRFVNKKNNFFFCLGALILSIIICYRPASWLFMGDIWSEHHVPVAVILAFMTLISYFFLLDQHWNLSHTQRLNLLHTRQLEAQKSLLHSQMMNYFLVISQKTSSLAPTNFRNVPDEFFLRDYQASC